MELWSRCCSHFILFFTDQVQPICLPTLEELQSYDWVTLSILNFDNSPILRDKPVTRQHLAKCKHHCLEYEKFIRINNTNLICLQNMRNNNKTTIIGFYSPRKDTKNFILLEASRYYCNNGYGLLLKLNYKDHIQWTYDNMYP